MINNLKFHHIGIACKNIKTEAGYFETLGYKPVSEIFVDNNQKIKGLFIEAAGQPRLELLENACDDGPLNSCLAKGIKFYHLAYETTDLENVIADFIAQKAMVIKPITDAVYFHKVCFLMTKNMVLIELVQPKQETNRECTSRGGVMTIFIILKKQYYYRRK